jgi:hypothetical protein
MLKNDYFHLFEKSFWPIFENYLFSSKMKYLYEYRVTSIFQKVKFHRLNTIVELFRIHEIH